MSWKKSFNEVLDCYDDDTVELSEKMQQSIKPTDNIISQYLQSLDNRR